jgi:hypothetical protein
MPFFYNLTHHLWSKHMRVLLNYFPIKISYFLTSGPAGEMALRSNLSYMIDKRDFLLRRGAGDAPRWRHEGVPDSNTANQTRESVVTTLLIAVLSVRAEGSQRHRLRQSVIRGDNNSAAASVATKIVFFLPNFTTTAENLEVLTMD